MTKPPKFLDATAAPQRTGSRYPAPHDEPCKARVKYILGDVFGLDQFGVNLVTLEPGSWSSQRHWHEKEDEFIFVVSGELVLADDTGEHLLQPGMCAGFKAGNGNGHCLKNLTDKPAQYLEVGTRSNHEVAWYSDIDLKVELKDRKASYTRKDGSAF
ncbi:MAG: cupin domain-containing protein [Alphaproteobacteria bacterium]|nr:cupin domain-containing protein [Alphaproteobacteria bacterium]